MSNGCRDCTACTAPATTRMARPFVFTWWTWMFKMFMRTCPQCKHMMGRHQRRADGSFRD